VINKRFMLRFLLIGSGIIFFGCSATRGFVMESANTDRHRALNTISALSPMELAYSDTEKNLIKAQNLYAQFIQPLLSSGSVYLVISQPTASQLRGTDNIENGPTSPEKLDLIQGFALSDKSVTLSTLRGARIEVDLHTPLTGTLYSHQNTYVQIEYILFQSTHTLQSVAHLLEEFQTMHSLAPAPLPRLSRASPLIPVHSLDSSL